MAEINEKILFHYLHNIDYLQDDQNVIGASTSLTLRTLGKNPTGGSTKYVKKFGNAYTITDITAGSLVTPRSDGGGVNRWWYEFYDFDTHTLMATVKDENGASAFVDGAALAAPASGIYVKIVWKTGTATPVNNDQLSVNTDIDPGGRNLRLSTESITAGEMLLYFAYNSSSYYMDDINDQSAKYGGYRQVGNGSLRRPYYNIQDAINALGGAFDNVNVLDSETYDEELDINVANSYVQAALGETPTITRGVGARITREVEHDGNNSDTRYVSKDGDDANPGTYQEPYLTIQFAENNMGGLLQMKIMDSEVYSETIIINVAHNLAIEPLYGHIPQLIVADAGVNAVIDVTLGAPHTTDIYGLYIDGLGVTPAGILNSSNDNCERKDNTITNVSGAGITFNGNFFWGAHERNKVYNCGEYGISAPSVVSHLGTIVNNYIYNNTIDGIFLNGTDVQTDVNNNVIYDNGDAGLNISGAGGAADISGTIENNTIYNNTQYGIEATSAIGFTGSFKNNIVYGNGTFDLFENGGVALSITESIYGTNSGFTIGAGMLNEDPVFCKATSTYKLGIASSSGGYRTDTVDADMGAHLRIIEYNESDIEVNGFLIDGQGYFNNGLYILDDIDHIDNSLKWCSIYDFQGIAIDPYDDDANTNFTISNCKIYNNGDAVKFTYGGNTIQESLLYNNAYFNIHTNYTGNTINHVVCNGGRYGLYLGVNIGALITNSIFNENSVYSIYSEVNISITYCCVVNAINNVDITDTSNFTDDPLFINTNAGSEDLHIKTREGDFIHESPCKDSSDDTPVQDIGAYNVLRSVENESRQKYQLVSNPRNMDPSTKIKGPVNINNSIGGLKRYALAEKWVFPLEYADNDYQTEAQRETLRYLARLIPGVGSLTEDQAEILLHLLPSQKLFEGTAGTFDATEKTIDDAAQTWNRDQYKGFWTGVKFTSGVSLVIDATLKTGTKAGAGWTIDEWIGYYFYHNYNYYYILSNTATVLTFSDPDGTLLDETAATYAIEKYFKILQNTINQILLDDPDSELVSGSYDFYIDFIKVQSTNKDHKPKQDSGYFYQKNHQKTGFSNTFEEL